MFLHFYFYFLKLYMIYSVLHFRNIGNTTLRRKYISKKYYLLG